MDYFCGAYLESVVFIEKFETINPLGVDIWRVLAENWASQLEFIRASHADHLSETIFISLLSSL